VRPKFEMSSYDLELAEKYKSLKETVPSTKRDDPSQKRKKRVGAKSQSVRKKSKDAWTTWQPVGKTIIPIAPIQVSQIDLAFSSSKPTSFSRRRKSPSTTKHQSGRKRSNKRGHRSNLSGIDLKPESPSLSTHMKFKEPQTQKASYRWRSYHMSKTSENQSTVPTSSRTSNEKKSKWVDFESAPE